MRNALWTDLGADMTLAIFLAGIFVGTFGACGLFFLKFWKTSRDQFFLYFAVACWLLVLERCAVVMLDGVYNFMSYGSESIAWIYLIRLSAFAMIFVAVLQKNRVGSR